MNNFARYDAKKDKVVCWIKPSYGPKSWQLPLEEIEYPRDEEEAEYYKFFARFLLEGKVLKIFESFEVISHSHRYL